MFYFKKRFNVIFPVIFLVKKVCFKLFVKESSAAELATSYASMNRCGKTNARKGPEKDYNSYTEFFERETEAHVLAKWMEFTGMENIEGKLKTLEELPLK